MAREHLEKRARWQGEAAARGGAAEDVFSVIMESYCSGTPISTVHKPKDLRGIYGKRHNKQTPHGIEPEFCFHNTDTNRRFYVEMKRQRPGGNAHERACKYFAPGILLSLREIANQPDNVVPIWFIFSDGLATDPNRRQEITHWFKGFEGNLLLWQNLRDYQVVIDHFDKYIRPLLD